MARTRATTQQETPQSAPSQQSPHVASSVSESSTMESFSLSVSAGHSFLSEQIHGWQTTGVQARAYAGKQNDQANHTHPSLSSSSSRQERSGRSERSPNTVNSGGGSVTYDDDGVPLAGRPPRQSNSPPRMAPGWRRQIAEEVLPDPPAMDIRAHIAVGSIVPLLPLTTTAVQQQQQQPPHSGNRSSTSMGHGASDSVPTSPSHSIAGSETPRSILRQPGSERRHRKDRRISFVGEQPAAGTDSDDDEDFTEPSLQLYDGHRDGSVTGTADPQHRAGSKDNATYHQPPRQPAPSQPVRHRKSEEEASLSPASSSPSSSSASSLPHATAPPAEEDEETIDLSDERRRRGGREGSGSPGGSPERYGTVHGLHGSGGGAGENDEDVLTQPHLNPKSGAVPRRRQQPWWPTGAPRDAAAVDAADPPTEGYDDLDGSPPYDGQPRRPSRESLDPDNDDLLSEDFDSPIKATRTPPRSAARQHVPSVERREGSRGHINSPTATAATVSGSRLPVRRPSPHGTDQAHSTPPRNDPLIEARLQRRREQQREVLVAAPSTPNPRSTPIQGTASPHHVDCTPLTSRSGSLGDPALDEIIVSAMSSVERPARPSQPPPGVPVAHFTDDSFNVYTGGGRSPRHGRRTKKGSSGGGGAGKAASVERSLQSVHSEVERVEKGSPTAPQHGVSSARQKAAQPLAHRLTPKPTKTSLARAALAKKQVAAETTATEAERPCAIHIDPTSLQRQSRTRVVSTEEEVVYVEPVRLSFTPTLTQSTSSRRVSGAQPPNLSRERVSSLPRHHDTASEGHRHGKRRSPGSDDEREATSEAAHLRSQPTRSWPTSHTRTTSPPDDVSVEEDRESARVAEGRGGGVSAEDVIFDDADGSDSTTETIVSTPRNRGGGGSVSVSPRATSSGRKVMKKKLVVVVRRKRKDATPSDDDPVVRLSLLPIRAASALPPERAEHLERLIDHVGSPTSTQRPSASTGRPRASSWSAAAPRPSTGSRPEIDEEERRRFRRALSVASSRSASRRSSVSPRVQRGASAVAIVTPPSTPSKRPERTAGTGSTIPSSRKRSLAASAASGSRAGEQKEESNGSAHTPTRKQTASVTRAHRQAMGLSPTSKKSAATPPSSSSEVPATAQPTTSGGKRRPSRSHSHPETRTPATVSSRKASTLTTTDSAAATPTTKRRERSSSQHRQGSVSSSLPGAAYRPHQNDDFYDVLGDDPGDENSALHPLFNRTSAGITPVNLTLFPKLPFTSVHGGGDSDFRETRRSSSTDDNSNHGATRRVRHGREKGGSTTKKVVKGKEESLYTEVEDAVPVRNAGVPVFVAAPVIRLGEAENVVPLLDHRLLAEPHAKGNLPGPHEAADGTLISHSNRGPRSPTQYQSRNGVLSKQAAQSADEVLSSFVRSDRPATAVRAGRDRSRPAPYTQHTSTSPHTKSPRVSRAAQTTAGDLEGGARPASPQLLIGTSPSRQASTTTPLYAPALIVDDVGGLSKDWQDTLRREQNQKQKEQYLIESAAAGGALLDHEEVQAAFFGGGGGSAVTSEKTEPRSVVSGLSQLHTPPRALLPLRHTLEDEDGPRAVRKNSQEASWEVSPPSPTSHRSAGTSQAASVKKPTSGVAAGTSPPRSPAKEGRQNREKQLDHDGKPSPVLRPSPDRQSNEPSVAGSSTHHRHRRHHRKHSSARSEKKRTSSKASNADPTTMDARGGDVCTPLKASTGSYMSAVNPPDAPPDTAPESTPASGKSLVVRNAPPGDEKANQVAVLMPPSPQAAATGRDGPLSSPLPPPRSRFGLFEPETQISPTKQSQRSHKSRHHHHHHHHRSRSRGAEKDGKKTRALSRSKSKEQKKKKKNRSKEHKHKHRDHSSATKSRKVSRSLTRSRSHSMGSQSATRSHLDPTTEAPQRAHLSDTDTSLESHLAREVERRTRKEKKKLKKLKKEQKKLQRQLKKQRKAADAVADGAQGETHKAKEGEKRGESSGSSRRRVLLSPPGPPPPQAVLSLEEETADYYAPQPSPVVTATSGISPYKRPSSVSRTSVSPDPHPGLRSHTREPGHPYSSRRLAADRVVGIGKESEEEQRARERRRRAIQQALEDIEHQRRRERAGYRVSSVWQAAPSRWARAPRTDDGFSGTASGGRGGVYSSSSPSLERYRDRTPDAHRRENTYERRRPLSSLYTPHSSIPSRDAARPSTRWSDYVREAVKSASSSPAVTPREGDTGYPAARTSYRSQQYQKSSPYRPHASVPAPLSSLGARVERDLEDRARPHPTAHRPIFENDDADLEQLPHRNYFDDDGDGGGAGKRSVVPMTATSASHQFSTPPSPPQNTSRVLDELVMTPPLVEQTETGVDQGGSRAPLPPPAEISPTSRPSARPVTKTVNRVSSTAMNTGQSAPAADYVVSDPHAIRQFAHGVASVASAIHHYKAGI